MMSLECADLVLISKFLRVSAGAKMAAAAADGASAGFRYTFIPVRQAAANQHPLKCYWRSSSVLLPQADDSCAVEGRPATATGYDVDRYAARVDCKSQVRAQRVSNRRSNGMAVDVLPAQLAEGWADGSEAEEVCRGTLGASSRTRTKPLEPCTQCLLLSILYDFGHARSRSSTCCARPATAATFSSGPTAVPGCRRAPPAPRPHGRVQRNERPPAQLAPATTAPRGGAAGRGRPGAEPPGYRARHVMRLPHR